jgi:exosortase K
VKRLLSGITTQCASAGQIVFDHFAAYSRSQMFTAVLTVLVMLLLKRHYSLATAAQLNWILWPTAKLVSWFTSARLVLEIGVGYADFGKGIIVAPACAGVNFMIMAFGLTAFYGLRQMRRLPSQLAWLTVALVVAYGLTLVVNTIRIALSMTLYNADIYTDWLTPARVHRLAGVVLYLGALWVHFLGLRRMMATYCRYLDCQNHHDAIQRSGWLVWGWYLLVALAVPLANRAWQNGSPTFWEHCLTVLIAVLAFRGLTVAIGHVVKIFYHDLQSPRAVLGSVAPKSSQNRMLGATDLGFVRAERHLSQCLTFDGEPVQARKWIPVNPMLHSTAERRVN